MVFFVMNVCSSCNVYVWSTYQCRSIHVCIHMYAHFQCKCMYKLYIISTCMCVCI